MHYNLYIPVFALIITVLINIVFDSKKKILTRENKLFSLMLKANLFDLLISISIVTWGYIGNYSMFAIKLLNKIDFITYIIWISCFFIYYYNLLEKKDISKVIIIIDIISIILIFITGINPYNHDGVMYVTGVSTNILYGISILFLLSAVICLILQLKKISKKHIPFFLN